MVPTFQMNQMPPFPTIKMEVTGLSEMLVATNKIMWHYFLKDLVWWVAQFMNLVAPLLTTV
jgi:hypothetical protein